jgi:hypothetical protein
MTTRIVAPATTSYPPQTAAAGPEPSRCHETPLRRLANNEADGAAPCEARARVSYFVFFFIIFFFAMILNPYGGC